MGNKQAKSSFNPKESKVPQGAPAAAEKNAKGKPPPEPPMYQWSFSRLDKGGPFCFSASDGLTIATVLQKLGQFERMSLQELRAANCHTVQVSEFCKAARDRLTEISQDDVEEMFSLRFSGTERIHAIQTGDVMRIVWWDPKHQVYPSQKKHT